MHVLDKSTWWNALASRFGFANDGLPTISSSEMLQTLTSNVTLRLGELTSSSFLATQPSVQIASGGDLKKPFILIAPINTGGEVVGNIGADYLSGSTRDDILYGGANSDFFVPRAGRDLIVGSAALAAKEFDTVSYETAGAGIVVDAAGDLPIPPASYNASYSAWAAGSPLSVTGFVAGAGGDVVNVYDLMSHVGYTGSNPVADGYLRLSSISSGLKIQFDPDGFSGSTSGSQAILLKGVQLADFSVAHNIVFASPPPAPVGPSAADYTLVSQDGDGGYDVLYSVENIIGSRFNDVIHGRNDSANVLNGGAGDDALYGEGGNDTLIGGSGNDALDGGTGDDLFLMGGGNDTLAGGAGRDTYKFAASYLTDAGPKSALIGDFQTGSGGDRIDISELLGDVYSAGADPFAGGYVSIRAASGGGTEILFDRDGSAGPESASVIATLASVAPGSFSIADNLTVHNSSPSILLTAILGQSNAASLRIIAGDLESGITRLEDGLRGQTDFGKVHSLLKDVNGTYIDTAVGGTYVNSDANPAGPGEYWWRPSENKPGDLTIRAADILMTQVTTLRAQGDLTPVVIWGQGEVDAYVMGAAPTEEARLALQKTYMDATLSVFNYLLEHVSSDLQFYIMQTGRYSVNGALAAGIGSATIDKTVFGLTYVREAQEQLALTHKNIHLAVNYADLPLFAEEPVTAQGYEASWAKDQWHLSYESKEIVGDRLADFIAQDLGFDHVIDNPGNYPVRMLSDLTIHEGSGLTVEGNANDNIITGTTGDDTLRGGAGRDALVGGSGKDVFEGGSGVDTMLGGTGADSFVFKADSAFTAVDVVMDFKPGEGDILDLFDLLGLYRQNGGNLNSFVTIVDDGHGNGILSVDRDGAGGAFSPVQIAVLNGFGGLADVTPVVYAGDPPDPVIPLAPKDDLFSGAEDSIITGNVLADNGSGADQGSGLSVQGGILATAQGGTVSLSASGAFTYTPAANYNGVDSFSYTVTDAEGHSAPATVSFQIAPVNDVPVAQDDAFTVVSGQTVSGNLTGNDSDVEGNPLSIIAHTAVSASGATVSVGADGAFSYTAASGFSGTDSFTYTLSDGAGGTDTATVTLTVLPAPPENTPPEAKDDAFTVAYGQTVSGSLTGNDSDVEGNPLSVIAHTALAASGGTVSVGADGAFSYTAADGFVGVDSFTYTLSDGAGGTDTATVALTITAPAGAKVGTAGDNTIKGGATGEYIFGLDGNDTVNAGGGADTIYGGAGNDTIDGGSDMDTMVGGAGNDTYYIDRTTDVVVEKAGEGIDAVYSKATFTLADNVENLFMTDNNAINGTGNAGDNIMVGNAGKNTLSGGEGNDTLRGGAGRDVLHGDVGNDVLYGDGGTDTLYGGAGSDSFRYDAGTLAEIQSVQTGSVADIRDIIADFTAGEDKLDISALLTAAGYTGTDAIADGYVSVTQQGANAVISVDTDGTAGALAGVGIATLSSTDAGSFDLAANIVTKSIIV